jgi:uncharacterized protein YeaO (DUF488 family)
MKEAGAGGDELLATSRFWPRETDGVDSGPAMSVVLKRVYEPAARSDGYRVLVDRVWPRGITKDALRIDAWLRELAPSASLRKWFGHDPAKWDEFKERYARELEGQAAALARLAERARKGRVTLLFAAKDAERNNAVALREHLERRLQQQGGAPHPDA